MTTLYKDTVEIESADQDIMIVADYTMRINVEGAVDTIEIDQLKVFEFDSMANRYCAIGTLTTNPIAKKIVADYLRANSANIVNAIELD